MTGERGKNEEEKIEWGRRGREKIFSSSYTRMCTQGREEKSERRGHTGARLLAIEF